MKISCPACTAKYSIADERVLDRLAKVRCRKCGATIVIDGKASPPNVYTAQEEAAETADHGEAATEYSVDFGEGDQRSMTAREIAKAYESGSITAETYVWTDGFADWKLLGDVPELLETVQAVAPQKASIETKASPWGSSSTAGSRAAARSPRSATNDLFGSIATAGNEDDAPGAPQQLSHASSSAASSASGSRNESSVLFSLSALTSQANARPSARPVSAASRDDSGLIDLKALTAAAMKGDAVSAPVAPVMPAVPLNTLGRAPAIGLASPLGSAVAATADVHYGYPAQRSRWPVFIGGGIAIGMIAIAGAILLRPEPPPPPAPIVVAAPTVPSPAPTPTPQQEALPPSTGAGQDAPAPSAAPRSVTVNRPRRVSGPNTPPIAPKKGGADSSTSPAPASKPAPPKSSGCGCATGDLQCAMRCAAKGG